MDGTYDQRRRRADAFNPAFQPQEGTNIPHHGPTNPYQGQNRTGLLPGGLSHPRRCLTASRTFFNPGGSFVAAFSRRLRFNVIAGVGAIAPLRKAISLSRAL